MGIELQDIIASLPKERQERIEQRTKALIAEQIALEELRKALGITQVELADILGISQENISRMEKRKDMKISTLRRYIEAVGGKLNLVVQLPGKEPIELSSLSEAT